VGRTPIISGVIQPAKSRVRLVITRRVGRRNVRVGSFSLRARHGRFRKAFRLPARGLYSYRVLFAGDRSNVKASSSTLHIRAV